MCLVVSTLLSILQLNNHTRKVTFSPTFFFNYSQKWDFYNFFELPHGVTQKNHDFSTFTKGRLVGEIVPVFQISIIFTSFSNHTLLCNIFFLCKFKFSKESFLYCDSQKFQNFLSLKTPKFATQITNFTKISL